MAPESQSAPGQALLAEELAFFSEPGSSNSGVEK